MMYEHDRITLAYSLVFTYERSNLLLQARKILLPVLKNCAKSVEFQSKRVNERGRKRSGRYCDCEC
jgi:hypothetical protein